MFTYQKQSNFIFLHPHIFKDFFFSETLEWGFY